MYYMQDKNKGYKNTLFFYLFFESLAVEVNEKFKSTYKNNGTAILTKKK